MYERNAIVIDRYFAKLFGYDQSSNLKNNANNYFELVKKFEDYQKASETENDVMVEFEEIANQIRETQKLQEVLNKRSLKYNETRKNLFENLDEDAEHLNRKFENIEEDIRKNDEEISVNTEKFVAEIREFNIKSEIRTECGRERRIIESDYQKKLDFTTDNFKKVNREKLKSIKAFVKSEDKDDEKEKIITEILRNGAKERIPFDENVIVKAIDVTTDIEEKKAEILLSVFDKTGKFLEEIKNDNTKIERHKKIVRDSKSKLEFLSVINDYIVLFLDNERMNIAGGEREHENTMLEACDHLQKDLIQIQNMYSLIIKEITDKATKKAYRELYNIQYLFDLEDEQRDFEQNISKLNMVGAIIYPDYWRIEGMQKVFDTFKHIVTDIYERDLKEFEPLEITSAVNEDILKIEDEPEDDADTEYDINDKKSVIEEDNSYDIDEDEEIEEDEEEEVEEFQWDDDDENEELFFDNSIIKEKDEEEEDDKDNKEDDYEKEIEFDEENDTEDEEENEETERDKEIDKILGLFDDEEDDNEIIDFDDFDSEDDSDEDFLEENNEEKIFDEEEKEEENETKDNKKKKNKSQKDKKPKKEKKTLFGRRKE